MAKSHPGRYDDYVESLYNSLVSSEEVVRAHAVASGLREFIERNLPRSSHSQEALSESASLIFKLATAVIDCVGETKSYDELQFAIRCLETIVHEVPEHQDCYIWEGTPRGSSWHTTYGQGSSAATTVFEEDTRRSLEFTLDAILHLPEDLRRKSTYSDGSGLLFPALLISFAQSLAFLENWTSEMNDFSRLINDNDLASIIGIHRQDFNDPHQYVSRCRGRLIEIALEHSSLDYPMQYYDLMAESLEPTRDMAMLRANLTSLMKVILGRELVPIRKGEYDIRPKIALKIAYSLDHQLGDKKLARRYYSDVNKDDNCDPERRIAAGYRLFRLLGDTGTDHLMEAYNVAASTLDLIAHSMSRVYDTTNRQNFLREWYQQDIKRLIYDGTYLAIRLEGAGKALRFLEKGRGIFANAIEEARIDADELKIAHNAMATEFALLQI